MKIFIYILTFVLLMVNNSFNENQLVKVADLQESMSCEHSCCTEDGNSVMEVKSCCSDESKSDKEPMSCCSESWCTMGYSNAFVIQQNFSPDVPTKEIEIVLSSKKFLYKNQYSFLLPFDVWNPPRV